MEGASTTLGQEIEITPDATKHVTPRLVHGSGEASAIVLPVNQANGILSSPSISNITADVYGFKGEFASRNSTSDLIHFLCKELTLSGSGTSAVNTVYTQTTAVNSRHAWSNGIYNIQSNSDNTAWQVVLISDSTVISTVSNTGRQPPASGWSNSVCALSHSGNGHPFTSDHIGLPLVYLNETVAPNRTPDIPSLVHGTTYFLKSIESGGIANTKITLQATGDTTGGGTIIDITDNSTALKAQTGGVYNLNNHFLASAVFATPRVNTFATGLSTSSNDTLYNTGSPSLNTNFSKTMTFNDGEICGVEILLWNVDGNKQANDAFIEYEGDPTITIDATEDTNKQTKVTLTYDSIGEYNIDVYIEDTGTGEVQTVKSGEGIQPRILGDRYLVQFDPQQHESAYTKKYSGLDLYVRNKNFTGSSFTGLGHLEGKTVTYKVNGGTAQTATVSNGAISVGSQTNANVIVGLPYTSTLAPLYVDAEGSMGSKKSVPHATIRFKDTLEAKVGQKETGTYGENSVSVLDNVKFASSSSLNTEDAEVWLANHNEFLQTVYIVSDTPQPCTVLAMVVDVEGV